jgi:hypothetical protein
MESICKVCISTDVSTCTVCVETTDNSYRIVVEGTLVEPNRKTNIKENGKTKKRTSRKQG